MEPVLAQLLINSFGANGAVERRLRARRYVETCNDRLKEQKCSQLKQNTLLIEGFLTAPLSKVFHLSLSYKKISTWVNCTFHYAVITCYSQVVIFGGFPPSVPFFLNFCCTTEKVENLPGLMCLGFKSITASSKKKRKKKNQFLHINIVPFFQNIYLAYCY